MGEVMQFLYGEDGMEGTAIEGQRMEFLRYNRRKFGEAYRYDLDRPGWAPDWLAPKVLEGLRTDGEMRAALEGELQVGGMHSRGCSCSRGGTVILSWPLDSCAVQPACWQARHAASAECC